MAIIANNEAEHPDPVLDLTISVRNIAFGDAADLETLRQSPAWCWKNLRMAWFDGFVIYAKEESDCRTQKNFIIVYVFDDM